MDSADPSGYIKDMRRRDKKLSKEWGQIATPLWIDTSGGKQRINCANTEDIFVTPENYLTEPESRKRLKP